MDMVDMRNTVDPKKSESFCSFCGKGRPDIQDIVSGPGVHICDGCVELCAEVLKERRPAPAGATGARGFPGPHEMSAFMDQYIVGQEWAKKCLAVGVYNHHKRVEAGEAPAPATEDVELSKSNILMLGPTGSGKTFLVQTLAKTIDVPLVIADATGLTQAGYMGESVDSILLSLIQAADNDIARAERGIVYIDEIDKIACRGGGSDSRDVSGEGVQQALLKALEGTVFTISSQTSQQAVPAGRGRGSQQALRIDTTNILFIVGGAFVGLDEIVTAKSMTRGMGFQMESGPAEEEAGDPLMEVTPDDLIEFGMIPEFISRLPMITSVRRLQEEDLLRVLTEPRNALVKQYRRLLKLDGVTLEFEDRALRAVVSRAIEQRTGARGLRAILDRLLTPLMYDIPAMGCVRRVVVTEAAVLHKEPPVLVRGSGQ